MYLQNCQEGPCSSDKDLQVLDKLSGRYSSTVPAGDDDGNVVVGIIEHTT